MKKSKSTKEKDKDLKLKTKNGDRMGELSAANEKKSVDHFSLAALNKKVELDAVLSRGIGVNARDLSGQTFLHHAAKNGAKDVLLWLLSKPNIQVDFQDNDGNTALHAATINKMEVTARCLVEAGANLEAKNHKGKTWYNLTTDQRFITAVGEGKLTLLNKQKEAEEKAARKEDRAERRRTVQTNPGTSDNPMVPSALRSRAVSAGRATQSLNTVPNKASPPTRNDSTRVSAQPPPVSGNRSPFQQSPSQRPGPTASSAPPAMASKSARITKEVVHPSWEERQESRYHAPQTVANASRVVEPRQTAVPRQVSSLGGGNTRQSVIDPFTTASFGTNSTLSAGTMGRQHADALFGDLTALVANVGISHTRNSLSVLLGLDEVLNNLVALIFTIQKIPGSVPLYPQEVDGILYATQSFLRALKSSFEASEPVFQAWGEPSLAEQARTILLRIKAKNFVELYNSVKALKEDHTSYRTFHVALIEANIEIWRLYSTCEKAPPEELLEFLKDSFVATKTLVDSLSNGSFHQMNIVKAQRALLKFCCCAVTSIFCTSKANQQGHLYSNMFTLIQGTRALVMSCQQYMSGGLVNQGMFSQLNELLVKCASHVKVITDELKGIPQGIPPEFPNTQLMTIGMRYLQESCDKFHCMTQDDRMVLNCILKLVEGIKKLATAYAQTPVDPLLVIDALNETSTGLAVVSLQLESPVLDLPLHNQETLRSVNQTLKQAGFQIKILGCLHSMSQVPSSLNLALIGFIVRHLAQMLCIGMSILGER